MEIEEKDLVEQIEKQYRVVNIDRDKFWEKFISDLLSEKDNDGNVSTASISSRLWSSIMQGFLKPKEDTVK